jgi:hypothetical protein
MSRYTFGGEITQLTVAPDATNADALKVAPTVAVPLYATVGGSVVTDFLLWDGTAFTIAATSITSDSDGYLPAVPRPDGVSTLYDSAGHALVARDFAGSGVPSGGTTGQVLTPSGWADPECDRRADLQLARPSAARSSPQRMRQQRAPRSARRRRRTSTPTSTRAPARTCRPTTTTRRWSSNSTDPTTGIADGTLIYRRSVASSGPPVVTQLIASGSTTDGTTFTTASISPTAGQLHLAIVTTGVVGGAAPLASTALTGAGLTWTRVADVSSSSGSPAGILHSALYVGTGTPSAGTVTIAPGGTVEGILWRFIDISNVNTTIVQSGTASPPLSSTTPGVTLSGVSGANMVIGFLAQNSSNTITPATGFTALGTTNSVTSPSIFGATEYKLAGQNSVTFATTGTVNRVAIAVEIAPA